MEQTWLIHDGLGPVWCGICRRLEVMGQYNLVLLGIKWYWVIIWLLCHYILKKVEIRMLP